MIYLKRQPGSALRSCIRLLWYCKAPDLPHSRERILPRGEMQVIVNLAGDALTDHSLDHSGVVYALPPCIIVGPRGRYDLVDSRDMAELAGVVFRPGGGAPFLHEDAAGFFEKFISLRDVISRGDVRSLLQEPPSPAGKILALEAWLTDSLAGRSPQRTPMTVHALHLLQRHSVADAARLLSTSQRRLHQVFKAEVGLSPKLWSRVHRFQRAVTLLHSGAQPRWEQLALQCGFYDQSHFCNEFRAFSGIDPSTYSDSHRLWANHIPE